MLCCQALIVLLGTFLYSRIISTTSPPLSHPQKFVITCSASPRTTAQAHVRPCVSAKKSRRSHFFTLARTTDVQSICGGEDGVEAFVYCPRDNTEGEASTKFTWRLQRRAYLQGLLTSAQLLDTRRIVKKVLRVYTAVSICELNGKPDRVRRDSVARSSTPKRGLFPCKFCSTSTTILEMATTQRSESDELRATANEWCAVFKCVQSCCDVLDIPLRPQNY